MIKILFLGYNSKETKLVKFLKKKNQVLEFGQKKLDKRFVKNFDLLISFGYKSIIKETILKSLKRPAINLHISYLPFNRGAHPNFWSFVERTPKGVAIHEISKKIDEGKIIKRKKIHFKITKRLTFESTYKKLFNEIEKLFIDNSKNIILGTYKCKKFKQKGTFHKKKDLPKNISNWDIKISSYLSNLT